MGRWNSSGEGRRGGKMEETKRKERLAGRGYREGLTKCTSRLGDVGIAEIHLERVTYEERQEEG